MHQISRGSCAPNLAQMKHNTHVGDEALSKPTVERFPIIRNAVKLESNKKAMRFPSEQAGEEWIDPDKDKLETDIASDSHASPATRSADILSTYRKT